MLELIAPAKLNLYLRVTGKRPDGFHELETLFERIDLADRLTFEPASSLALTCSDPGLSCGEDNLVLRAARLLQQQATRPAGARVHLEKRIPVAAGLGGGSSDAATTLIGLNLLWHLQLTDERLLALAEAVGSDVAFFLHDRAFMVGRGRGERCEPLATQLSLAQVVVVPDATLSTREIYEGSQFDLTARKPSITMVSHALRNGSLGELAQGLWNDLAPEAIRRCPSIARVQAVLREVGCLGVSLSGSGPSVFGLCRDRVHAQDVAERFPSAGDPSWRVIIAETSR